MSELNPEILAEIRSRLEIALSSALGTYKFKNQLGIEETKPAIYSVGNIDTDPADVYEKEGLECLIFRPEPSSQPYHSRNATLELTWHIRLIQHDRGASTMPGYRALLTAYPHARKQSWFPHDKDSDEQVNILLTTSEVVRAIN